MAVAEDKQAGAVAWAKRLWPLLLLLAAMALVFAMGWHRYLTLQELVERREALRALRRERRTLQRAIANQDGPGFARSAVTAFQIAAAPHYPAESRAMVCSDVLGLFQETDQRGRPGELIRALFEQNNAADFSREALNGRSLFDLKTELDRVLQQMEARL